MDTTKEGRGLLMIQILIITTLLWTGVRGEPVRLYHRVGDDVTLPCAYVIPGYPNCSSTTWLYSRDSGNAIDVINLGQIRATEHPAGDRLSLNPDCSLTVQRVTAQDFGLYVCRQFDSTGSQIMPEEHVILSLIKISPSPPVTDLKPGTRVTLTCSLLIFDVTTLCDQHISMTWLDGEGGKVLKSNQEEISGERRCSISLTQTLLEKDNNNRKFRCQLTDKRGNQETFIDFLVLFPENTNKNPGTVNLATTSTTTTQTASGISPWSKNNKNLLLLIVPIGGAVVLVGLVAAVFILFKRRRTESRVSSEKIVSNDLSVAMPTVHQSEFQQEDSEDKMTYASINHSENSKSCRHDPKFDAEMVTYATVKPSTGRGEKEPVDSNNLYATISQPSRAKN